MPAFMNSILRSDVIYTAYYSPYGEYFYVNCEIAFVKKWRNMQREIFKIGAALKSGTYYYGTQSEYHIYLQDTVNSAGCGYVKSTGSLATAFYLQDLADVTIDLGGAALIFHGRIAPFVLSRCKNITLKNFSIDYDRPYYTQGEILEASTKHLQLRISDGFPYRVENGFFYAVSDTWEQPFNHYHMLFQPYDPQTRAPAFAAGCILAVIGDEVYSPNAPLPIHHLSLEENKDGSLTFRGDFPETYKAGQILTMTHEPRDKNAILADHCQNVTVENVRLIHGASMGFVGMFCENIALKHFDMYLDEKCKGLITVNADSVHCFHCTGKILVEDCIFDNMLDDAINIHGNYTEVTATAGKEVKAHVAAAGLENIKWYQAGDVLNIYRGKTQELKDSYKVVKAEYPCDREIMIHFDRAVDAATGDIIENSAMPEIEIRRCKTGKNRPRGFLLSSGGKTLVENCFFNNCSCAIHFTGDTTYWYESGPVRDVIIRYCHFYNCGYCSADYAIMATPEVEVTEKVPCYHKNIKITDNIFESFTRGALYANKTEGIVFKNNRYIDTADYPRKIVDRVKLDNCKNCDIVE